MDNLNLEMKINGNTFDFSEIFDSIPRILALLTPEGIIIKVNKIGASISPIKYKLIGHSVWSLPFWNESNNDKTKTQKIIYEIIKKGTIPQKSIEIFFPAVNQKIWIRLFPIHDNLKKLKYLLVEGEYIDALSKIEHDLVQSEEKYRSLYISDNDAIMILDKTKGFLSGNPATIKMFHCHNEADFISKSPAELSPEFQPNGKLSETEQNRMIDLALEKGVHYFDWTHKRVDGSLFFATVLLNKMELHGEVLLHARIRDISEKVNAQSQKNRLLEIIESSPNLVSMSNLNNELIFINQSGKNLLGWNKNDIAAYRVRDSTPDWAFKKIVDVGRPLSIRDGVWTGETAIITTAGEEVPILQQIICHKNASGEPEYFSTIMINITDRKRMEDEQNRRQMIEAIALLAGGIAHDFNNLLTSILGNLSLLKMDERQSLENIDAISDAEKATLIASELAKQLLTFSRTKKLIKERQNLAKIIQDSANFSIRGTEITVKFDFEQGLWAVNGDKDQMSQVFLNLVLNSVQANPKDGIIRISAENLPLSVGNSMDLLPGNYVLVMVRDQGEGISSEDVKQIFNPYYTTKSTGVGLGLTITHAIINQHGGKIMVESQIGKGTIFSIYLPASDKPMSIQNDNPKHLPLEKLSKVKILVLEDEPLIVSLIHNFSKKLHISLNYSPNGHEIINSYRDALKNNTPFDIVILDLTIRGGIGGEVTMKELLDIDPNITAIASSGYSKKPVMENYGEYGFKAILKKPYTFEEFAATLLKLLD